MLGDSRVQELIEELLESERTPEEACRQCPELLPQVRERWLRLRACDAYLDALFPAPGCSSPIDLSSSAPLAAELPQIPGYEVQEVLGRGGMGVVYKARHLRLNRAVALKMLLAGADPSPVDRERFLREAEAVAGLRHPNIVQVHDMGSHNGTPYFTMEFVEGGNLAQKLADTPQPPRRAAALLATLAEAVQSAHQSGIVHRDLKPANVLLTADGSPKIGDFGLARRLDGEAGLTRSGTAVGTPSYMAPEQARAKPLTVGPPVDIYALGAILYELLTGRPPFRAETGAETVYQVLTQNPVPPSRRNGKVPRDLETVCLKCLHKEPHFRYASAAALAADLRRFLDGEAIAARPDGPLARLVRRVRRRPVRSALIAVATLLTVAPLGGGLWLLSERATAARESAAERVATERAAEEDLQETVRCLRTSSWPEAHAALERAKARVGDRGSAELRRLLEQGDRELELVARLEAIRLDLARHVLGFALVRTDERYEGALRGAGIGQTADDPEVVADRVRASNIRNALVGALDHWSGHTKDPVRKQWALTVARLADPDPTGWRDRARDPAIRIRADEAALVNVITTAPIADQSVQLYLALDRELNPSSPERLPFLKRIQHACPGDIWVNLTLGSVLLLRENKAREAIRYYQAAVSIDPRMPLSYHQLGMALIAAGRMEEAEEACRRAVDLDSTCLVSQQWLALTLTRLCRYADAREQLRAAIRLNPNDAGLHRTLGHNLDVTGRVDEALTQYRQALALDPKNTTTQMDLRNLLTRLGREDEARVAWQTALAADPPEHNDWYGYAEFCLFIGQEGEYRRARQALLARFGANTNPQIAERTARACLLLPATDEELRRACALAESALAVEPSKSRWIYSFFLFTRGLAEYRQGKFDRAISTMRGDASQQFGPGPRLVLAMALHRSGQSAEARQTLAEAVTAHHWSPNRVHNQNDWTFHVLRREAERMILPNLPAFLDGKYQPRDNDERLALIGVCQYTNRTRALTRLYTDAFAADPQVGEDVNAGLRYSAACTAALADSGQGADVGNLSPDERKHWREQARAWLKLDLAAWTQKLNGGRAGDRRLAWRKLTDWRADPDLAGLREPGALGKLPIEERNEWIALWKEVNALIDRATSA